MKTTTVKQKDIDRKWYVVDAKDVVLGRAATVIARTLTGKDKILKSANIDNGDHVIVINAGKFAVTGNKMEDKLYQRHSGWPGGFKELNLKQVMEKDPTYALKKAVKGMLPKNKYQSDRMTRLHIYAEAEHGHNAQKPEEIKL